MCHVDKLNHQMVFRWILIFLQNAPSLFERKEEKKRSDTADDSEEYKLGASHV